MSDALLSTATIGAQLVTWLDAILPSGVGVYDETALRDAATPFVVVCPTVPDLARLTLAGSNTFNSLTIVTYSVHSTLVEASALRDLVRTALVGTTNEGDWAHSLTLTGLRVLDRAITASPEPGVIAQVPQAAEAYQLTLARG